MLAGVHDVSVVTEEPDQVAELDDLGAGPEDDDDRHACESLPEAGASPLFATGPCYEGRRIGPLIPE
jgi:hypothetical protein